MKLTDTTMSELNVQGMPTKHMAVKLPANFTICSPSSLLGREI